MILWFGWYGFNPGSILGTGNTGLIGLVTINTAITASAGALSAIIYQYTHRGKWDLVFAIAAFLVFFRNAVFCMLERVLITNYFVALPYDPCPTFMSVFIFV